MFLGHFLLNLEHLHYPGILVGIYVLLWQSGSDAGETSAATILYTKFPTLYTDLVETFSLETLVETISRIDEHSCADHLDRKSEDGCRDGRMDRHKLHFLTSCTKLMLHKFGLRETSIGGREFIDLILPRPTDVDKALRHCRGPACISRLCCFFKKYVSGG